MFQYYAPFFKNNDEAFDSYIIHSHLVRGSWGGEAAKLLNLSGKVNGQDFTRLLNNLHPLTGQRLTSSARPLWDCAVELTWTFPVSISLYLALNEDVTMSEIIGSAYRETMAELESNTKARIPSARSRYKHRPQHVLDHIDRYRRPPPLQHTGNLLSAEFLYYFDRNAPWVYPQPLFQNNTVFLNSTFDHTDQHWKKARLPLRPRSDRIHHGSLPPPRSSGLGSRLNERLVACMTSAGYAIRSQGASFELAIKPRKPSKNFTIRTLAHRDRSLMYPQVRNRCHALGGFLDARRALCALSRCDQAWRARSVSFQII